MVTLETVVVRQFFHQLKVFRIRKRIGAVGLEEMMRRAVQSEAMKKYLVFSSDNTSACL